MPTAKGKNSANDGARGVAVTECAHRMPKGLLEAGRRMSDDPKA